MNGSLIITPHIHTHQTKKKKITHPKAHKYLDFLKSREKVVTNSPQIPFFFSGGDENRLLQLKIDLFSTVQ